MINVVDEYTKFITEEFCFYGKKIMEKYYISSIFNEFLNEYISIRYYNVYSSGKQINSDINKYLNKKIKEMLSTKEKEQNINFMAEIFKYLIALDANLDASNVNKFENELEKIRKKYSLLDDVEFSKEYREFKKRKNNFIKLFDTDDFSLVFKKTKYENVIDTTLKHNIKFSDLYNKKVIEEIYNTGIINEDKMFVYYNLIAIKVLNEIISYNYNTSYLVDFNIEMFNKKEKMNRLLKIIDNDVSKEKIIFKINYSLFLENKEMIFKILNDGYNMALVKDDQFQNNNYVNLFKYVLD